MTVIRSFYDFHLGHGGGPLRNPVPGPGLRASELLGMRGADIDYGGQMIAVTRKGTRAVQ